jgi:hypothetical protein
MPCTWPGWCICPETPATKNGNKHQAVNNTRTANRRVRIVEIGLTGEMGCEQRTGSKNKHSVQPPKPKPKPKPKPFASETRSPTSITNKTRCQIHMTTAPSSVADLSDFGPRELVTLLHAMSRGIEAVPETMRRGVVSKMPKELEFFPATLNLHFGDLLSDKVQTDSDAGSLVGSTREIGYFNGRNINTRIIAEREVDGRKYDKEYGDGAFVAIVDYVKWLLGKPSSLDEMPDLVPIPKK